MEEFNLIGGLYHKLRSTPNSSEASLLGALTIEVSAEVILLLASWAAMETAAGAFSVVVVAAFGADCFVAGVGDAQAKDANAAILSARDPQRSVFQQKAGD